MRLASIRLKGKETAGIVLEDGILPVAALNHAAGTSWEVTVSGLITTGQLRELTEWFNDSGKLACSRRSTVILRIFSA